MDEGWLIHGPQGLLNNILVISSRLKGTNERLCAMEPYLLLKRIPPPGGFDLDY